MAAREPRLLSPTVLLLKLLRTPQLAQSQTPLLLLPTVIRLLGDPHLPGHLRHRYPMLSLLQCESNLLLLKLLPIGTILLPRHLDYARKVTYPVDQFLRGSSN